jgi:hypothetical protein
VTHRQARRIAEKIAAETLGNNRDQVKGLAAGLVSKGQVSTPQEEEYIQMVFDEYSRIEDRLRHIS